MSTPTTTAIGHFVWHDHVSSDPDAATAFYTELLGWELDVWKPGDMDYPMIKHDDSHIGGFVKPQIDVPSHWNGYIVVEDIDATVSAAETAGGTVYMPATDIPDVGRFAILADGQGAVFSSIQQLAEGPGRPELPVPAGNFAWNELMTTDVDAAKAFYADAVGWTAETWPVGETPYHLFKSAGDDAAGLMAMPPGVNVPPHWMTYIAVDDVDGLAATATELGATVHMEPEDIPDVGRFAVLSDPTGAAVGLIASAAA